MKTSNLIAALEAERDRINRTIAALKGRNGYKRSSSGRRRTMSAAAKQRISLAMKRRWAERKKSV